MKKFIYGLLVIVALLLAGSLLIPNQYHNERSIMVKAPIAVVFDQANTLKNWEKWSPWLKMDPTMKMIYNNIPSGKGAMYNWNGENPNVGKGSMTIISSVPDQFIAYAMSFDGEGGATSAHRFEQVGDSVKVTWTFDNDMGYNPIVKYMMKIMNGMMIETFDNGLRAMKAAAESVPVETAGQIKVEEIEIKEGIPYLAIKAKASSAATIGQEIGKSYGLIGAVMKKQSLTFSKKMAPFAIDYKRDGDSYEFNPGIATDKPGKTEGDVFAGEMRAGKYLVVHYFGDYMNTEKGHNAIHSYANANNKTISGPGTEVYVTDPMIEKDTAKWQTDIYYPL